MFTAAEVLQLVEAIYAGIVDRTAWEAAIARLCRAFGGECGGLFVWDERTHRLLGLAPVELDQETLPNYGAVATLPDTNPLWRERSKAAVAGSVVAEVHANSSLWTDTELFEAWLVPRRMDQSLRAHMKPDPASIAMLALTRPARAKPFGAPAVDAMRRLQPHLLRAVQVRQRLSDITAFAGDALAALDIVEQGVLLVDHAATVIHANRAAEALLGRGDGIGTARLALTCDRADDGGALRSLIGVASGAMNSAAAGGTLAVRRRSGRRPLAVLVAPLRGKRPPPLGPPATAIVMVADPEAGVADPGVCLRRLYGLTQAEARTAAALLEHTRLSEIAAGLGVGLATVRTLLQRAFDKTGTHRQADLVRLMLAHRMPGGGCEEGMSRPEKDLAPRFA